MHSTGGKKSGSLEARSSSAPPVTGHDLNPSTLEIPTTDLLPLLSEAHSARVESDFEDAPEVVAEVPGASPQPFVERLEEADTSTGAIALDAWTADPLIPGPIPYEDAPDVAELDEEDVPELVADDPAAFPAALPSPVQAFTDPVLPVEVLPHWLDMVEEVVELIGEMEEDAHQLRVDQPDSADTCRHVAVRLTLMLARNGVTVIGIKEQGAVETIMGQTFDRARHQPATIDIPAKGARIVEVVSPGFAVGQRVLRRARVRCQ